jgi:hypothetical protein
MTTRRMLVDLRDNENMRGFHVLASLALIADRLQSVELYRLGGDAADENIAMQSFSFDTGLKFRRVWWLMLADSKFDIYVSAANHRPRDVASIAACKTSRHKITALMFEPPPGTLSLDGVVLNSHDTTEIARKIVDGLRSSDEGEAS